MLCLAASLTQTPQLGGNEFGVAGMMILLPHMSQIPPKYHHVQLAVSAPNPLLP